jgi:hypothetical protein
VGQWYEVTGTFGTAGTGRNCTVKRRKNSMEVINLFEILAGQLPIESVAV